jgi:hypothetical protein
MAGISDRRYLELCGRLASRLGISQASARRKVEIRAAKEQLGRDPATLVGLAETMLEEALATEGRNAALLNHQLKALNDEDQFISED